MLLKKTNIEAKLRQYRNKNASAENILAQVKAVLDADEKERERVESNLLNSINIIENNFTIDLLDSDKIYHIDQIKKICIDYRLRFLDSKYFKGIYPPEAISKIKELEKKHQAELKGFKIVAPSKLFKLENADDPLLFAPIGNGYFYLIHKWGNDLHPLRKLLVLPFKSFFNLFILVLLISWFLTELIPIRLFTKEYHPSTYWILYIFMFKMVGSMVLFYGFALGKNFNHAIWNSKYFNV